MDEKSCLQTSLGGEWRLKFLKNSEFVSVGESGFDGIAADEIPAEVPGNFELDFFRAGLCGDPYFADNILKMQDFECLHLFYYRDFVYGGDGGGDDFLVFSGIDTLADIYIDGALFAAADNMFIPHEFSLAGICAGKHSILVHIRPAHIDARSRPLEMYVNAHRYNFDAMGIRKAAHGFGWDIMPRLLSGGIWKDVYIERRPTQRICDAYLYTIAVRGNDAELGLHYNLLIGADSLKGYELEVCGVCGGHRFYAKDRIWNTSGKLFFKVSDFLPWEPKNSGEPNLYEVCLRLLYAGETVDERRFRTGIRTVRLERSSTTDEGGNGEFCFYINGRKTFMLGTNIVPFDAFHSKDRERIPKALELLDEIGCNMVRCWGGSVYEDEIFYDWCDEHGVMVWQDFMMGCAAYPQEEAFLRKVEAEALSVVRRLRQHPCIVLWAGDNECDYAVSDWWGSFNDPNKNKITREVLPAVVMREDYVRPFLPSSPFIDREAFESGKPLSEEHIWGPRDYFKSDFYKNSVCHFASETGYHGCPSPESLAKFLPPDRIWPWDGNEMWIIHGTSPEPDERGSYNFRNNLMASQIEVLFGFVPTELDDFYFASQISQAEAMKYFIEKFRTSKWRRTGIIWWNLIDGWPQISDAVTDYYYEKKLAFFYIKRSQNPVLAAFDEPDEQGFIGLHIVNDTQKGELVRYRVSEAGSGDLICDGEVLVPADGNICAERVLPSGHKPFYLIEYEYGGAKYKNHYQSDTIALDFEVYKRNIKKCGFSEEYFNERGN